MDNDELESGDDKWEAPKMDYAGAIPSSHTSAQSAISSPPTTAQSAKTSSNIDEAKNSTEQIASELEDGPNQPLKFGTVGRSGVGKSSFINVILNKRHGDKDYAKTGIGNTTRYSKSYTHSNHQNFTIWDTPGFGSLTMSRDVFLETVNLETFDFFFLFFDTIIQCDELWIAEKLSDLHVPFCLVRCKLDLLVENVKKSSKPNRVNAAIEELRVSLNLTMERFNVLKNLRIFLISNLPIYFQYGDWTDLLLFVADKIPDVKREALFSILPVLTSETLTIKYKELRGRINKVASLTGIIAASPVPFLDAPINIALVVREVRRYRDVLGLNSDFAKHHAPAETSMKEKVMEGIRMASTAAFSGAIATAGILLSNVDVLLPVVGSAISAVSVNEIVSYYLNKTLDQTYEEAKNLYQRVTTPNKQ